MRKLLGVGICLSLLVFYSFVAYGDENILKEELDYDEIQKNIDTTDAAEYDFEEEINKVVASGRIDYTYFFSDIMDKCKNLLVGKKDEIVRILVIVILIGLISNFVNLIENEYVSQTSFMIIYMSLTVMVVKVYMQVSNIGVDVISKITGFINVLLPTYTVASVVSGGITSAIGFNQITVIVIMIIEQIYLKVVIPLINIYLLVIVTNNIYSINNMSRLIELIKYLVKTVMKISLFIIMGMSTIEKMIGKSSDAAKINILNRGINVIPYVGEGVKNINETIMNSAILIRNALGGVSIVILMIICLIPIINIVIYIFTYDVVASISEVVSDKRVVNCIKAISDSSKLLLEVVVTSMALFIISIAMVAS